VTIYRFGIQRTETFPSLERMSPWSDKIRTIRMISLHRLAFDVIP
jgi:hypothetical protein